MAEDTAPEKINVEEIVSRTLNEYVSRQRQEEEAEAYEQQELRKFALDLAIKCFPVGSASTSYMSRANEFVNYIKSGS